MTIDLLFAGSGITALPIIFISAFTQLIYIVATSLNLKRKKYSGMFIFSVIYLLLNVYILFLIFPHGDVNYFSLFSILLQNGKRAKPFNFGLRLHNIYVEAVPVLVFLCVLRVATYKNTDDTF